MFELSCRASRIPSFPYRSLVPILEISKRRFISNPYLRTMLFDESEFSEHLFVESDDTLRFALAQEMRTAFVGYFVAYPVRFPGKVDCMEIHAIDIAHLVGDGLALVAERIEQFIEHNIGLEDREPPILFEVGTRLLGDARPA